MTNPYEEKENALQNQKKAEKKEAADRVQIYQATPLGITFACGNCLSINVIEEGDKNAN